MRGCVRACARACVHACVRKSPAACAGIHVYVQCVVVPQIEAASAHCKPIPGRVPACLRCIHVYACFASVVGVRACVLCVHKSVRGVRVCVRTCGANGRLRQPEYHTGPWLAPYRTATILTTDHKSITTGTGRNPTRLLTAVGIRASLDSMETASENETRPQHKRVTVCVCHVYGPLLFLAGHNFFSRPLLF